jgi:hypothetical protein
MGIRTIATAACVFACPLLVHADQLKPRMNLDFGTGAQVQPQAPPVTFGAPAAPQTRQTDQQKALEAAARAKLQALDAAKKEGEGFDCKMVRPVDPNFHSKMPVVRPPEDVKFAMKVIPAPPCRQ